MILGIFGIFAQNNESESKNRILTENRKIGNFDKIEVHGRFEVKLTQQENTSLSVSAQEKYLEFIETYVDNGTLIIGMKEPDKNKGFFDKLKEKYSDYTKVQRFEINVGVKNLESIEMSGASSLSTKNDFKLEKLSIDISGASKLTMDCDLNNAKIDASGASSILINGSAKDVSLDISGASSFKGIQFKCNKVMADVSGASSVKVYVSEKFIGDASGASAIHCYGNPDKVQRDVSGASKITME